MKKKSSRPLVSSEPKEKRAKKTRKNSTDSSTCQTKSFNQANDTKNKHIYDEENASQIESKISIKNYFKNSLNKDDNKLKNSSRITLVPLNSILINEKFNTGKRLQTTTTNIGLNLSCSY